MHALRWVAPVMQSLQLQAAVDLAHHLPGPDGCDAIDTGILWVWGHGQVKISFLERCSIVNIQFFLQGWPHQWLWRVL